MDYLLFVFVLAHWDSGDGASWCVAAILVRAIAIQINTYIHPSFWKLGLVIYQWSVLEPEI